MWQVVERVRLFLNSLSAFAEKYASVLVVCHGETMWAFRILLEGISENDFSKIYASHQPEHLLYNCHILHYHRKQTADRFLKLRSVCAYNPEQYDSGWQII